MRLLIRVSVPLTPQAPTNSIQYRPEHAHTHSAHSIYPTSSGRMAPANTRKRKSDEMEPQETGAVTPTGSPARKRMRITQQQKQALIDNRQLGSQQGFPCKRIPGDRL